MQIFYRLQQRKTEKVTVYVAQLEGTLNAVQKEYPMILSISEVPKHLRDCLFNELHK